MMQRLRLVVSRRTLRTSPTLSRVAFRQLPIVTLEQLQTQRLHHDLARLAHARPVLYSGVVSMVSRLCQTIADKPHEWIG
jgi:hypothetical protein